MDSDTGVFSKGVVLCGLATEQQLLLDGLVCAQQLIKDVVVSLLDILLMHARLFQQVPLYIGARDLCVIIELDANKFALQQRLLLVKKYAGAIQSLQSATSCCCEWSVRCQRLPE